MSISKLDGYKQPLNFTADVDFLKEVIADEDVNVSGTITGSGWNTDITDKNNEWTGTNDMTGATINVNTTTLPDYLNGDDSRCLSYKQETDTYFSGYDPTPDDNEWATQPTFSGAITLPDKTGTAMTDWDDNVFLSYNNMDTATSQSIPFPFPTDSGFIFSGDNVFNVLPKLGVTVVPTADNDAVDKQYVDSILNVADGTLTLNFTSTGTFKLDFTDATLDGTLGHYIKAEMCCWSASTLLSGPNACSTGAYASASIGNGAYSLNNIVIQVGKKNSGYWDKINDKWYNYAGSSYIKNAQGYIVGCLGGFTDNDSTGNFQAGKGLFEAGDFGMDGAKNTSGTTASIPFNNGTQGTQNGNGYCKLVLHFCKDNF